MDTISRAWYTAVDAIQEARDIGQSGGNVEAVRDLLQHAREMVDVIETELTEGLVRAADLDVIRMAAAELRKRVDAAAATLAPLH
jgi:hypothetical protein